MSIPNDPTAQRIAQEFDNGTRTTSVTQYNLAYLHSVIFGGSSHDRRDFTGYGQNIISSLNAYGGSEDGGKISMSFTLNSNVIVNSAIPCIVRVQFSERDGLETIPSNPWETLSQQYTLPTSGGKGINNITMPKANQGYFIRLQFWNKFNSVGKATTPFTTATSSQPVDTGPTVGVTNLQYQGGGFGNTYPHSWQYITSGQTSFMVECRFDTGSGWESAGAQSISSSGTSYSGSLQTGVFFPPAGATQLEFRMRRNTSEAWAFGSAIQI